MRIALRDQNKEAMDGPTVNTDCIPLQLQGKESCTSLVSIWRLSCTIYLRRSKASHGKKGQRSFATN